MLTTEIRPVLPDKERLKLEAVHRPLVFFGLLERLLLSITISSHPSLIKLMMLLGQTSTRLLILVLERVKGLNMERSIQPIL